MGSLHTMRDKHQIALIDSSPILQISRSGLATSGPVVAEITARSVDPGTGLMGFNITFDSEGDLSPACNISTDALCDGGAYDNYNMEVVDRMGADSFCPDSGVMISKTRNSDNRQPFQWVIDANPQDAKVVDFYLPNGTARYWSIGDYRQLVDALFHAGTNSGSEFEYVSLFEFHFISFHSIPNPTQTHRPRQQPPPIHPLQNTLRRGHPKIHSRGTFPRGCSLPQSKAQPQTTRHPNRPRILPGHMVLFL